MQRTGFQVLYWPFGRTRVPDRSPLFETETDCDDYMRVNPVLRRYGAQCVRVVYRGKRVEHTTIKDYKLEEG